MSEEQRKKTHIVGTREFIKTHLVGTLLLKTIVGIEDINAHQFEEEPPFLDFTFTKNPALKFKTTIALTETWNVVKRSVQKMAESDGICVVCFETPKYDYIPHCPTCNEVVCGPCVVASKTTKCPVCRSCLFMDIHKLKKDECRCP